MSSSVQDSKRSISDLWCLCVCGLCPQSSTFRPDSLQRRLEAASSIATWLQGLVVPVNDSTHSQRACEAFIGNALCSFLKTKLTRTFQKEPTKSQHWLFNSGLVWNTKRQKRQQREWPHIFSFENCLNSIITQILFQHASTMVTTIELPPKCKTFVYASLLRTDGRPVYFVPARRWLAHSVTPLPGHEGLQHSHVLFGEIVLSNHVFQRLEVTWNNEHRLYLVLTLNSVEDGDRRKPG